jgi:hypothetical protein
VEAIADILLRPVWGDDVSQSERDALALTQQSMWVSVEHSA